MYSPSGSDSRSTRWWSKPTIHSMKILIYRPGIAPANSAFEAQALIYRYLQQKHGWSFHMLLDDADTFTATDLKISRFRRARWHQILPEVSLLSNKVLSSLVRTEAPDLLLGSDPTIYGQGRLALRVAERRGVPFVFDVSMTVLVRRSFLSRQLAIRTGLADRIERSAGMIMTSPKCMERFRVLGYSSPRLASRCLILGHPVDTSRFFPLPDRKIASKRIIVVSRLVPEKGIQYIFEALAPLLEARRAWSLQFVGGGPLLDYLRREVSERNLEGQVILSGEVPYQDVPNLLREADVFVNHAVDSTMWEEYFGLANIEAMACGLACVVSDSGSISWVLREEGIAAIVTQRSVVEMRRRVLELMENTEARSLMSSKAIEYVNRNYALPVIAEKYRRFFETIKLSYSR
jgi:glycosyltransferase involved in cell wall biosynthesis